MRATTRCLAICDKRFGRQHYRNYPANAFRHALWNIMIAHGIQKRGCSAEESVAWTERITEKYEELSPNDPLDLAMDLHNNEVGRKLFREYPQWEERAIVERLLGMTALSRKLESVKDIPDDFGVLVHILDVRG